jgi:hypothetical protein
MKRKLKPRKTIYECRCIRRKNRQNFYVLLWIHKSLLLLACFFFSKKKDAKKRKKMGTKNSGNVKRSFLQNSIELNTEVKQGQQHDCTTAGFLASSPRGVKVRTHVYASPPMLGILHALFLHTCSCRIPFLSGPWNLKANTHHDDTSSPRLLTSSPWRCGSLHATLHHCLHLPAEMISAALTPSATVRCWKEQGTILLPAGDDLCEIWPSLGTNPCVNVSVVCAVAGIVLQR